MNCTTEVIKVNPHSQSGVALIASMLMLLILTLIGVTAMLVTALEEKMSGNQRDRSLAFHAAESALRVGEKALVDAIKANNLDPGANPLPTFHCTGAGVCPLVNVSDPASWSAGGNDCLKAGACTYTGDLSNGQKTVLASQPQYLIELFNNGEPVASQGIDYGHAGSDSGAKKLQYNYCYYRITARGVGGTSAAVVVLQSNYISYPGKVGACHE